MGFRFVAFVVLGVQLIRTGFALSPILLEWLESVPGAHHSVQISSFASNERGLVAARDIAPDEVVAKIPLTATLQVHFGDLGDERVDDSWAGALAAKLWMESIDSSSSVKPYITEGLPADPPNVLCRWSDEEREALQNATLHKEIEANDDWRRRQFELHGGDCQRDDFLYFLDLVCSRTLYRSSTKSRFLVPLIDLANHAPTEANGGHFVFDKEAKNVYLMAGFRGVQKGEPIYLDYGGRTIDDFLMHYGFCPDRCQSDGVCLPNGKSVSWTTAATLVADDPASALLCKTLLDSYPTSLNEDLRELREPLGGPITMSHEMALRYRIAKKSLLKTAAGFSPYQ